MSLVKALGYDRLLVEPIVEETKSSIIIPLTVKPKQCESRVIEAADTQYVGETILHRPNTGIEIEIEGKNYLILKQTEILAIV